MFKIGTKGVVRSIADKCKVPPHQQPSPKAKISCSNALNFTQYDKFPEGLLNHPNKDEGPCTAHIHNLKHITTRPYSRVLVAYLEAHGTFNYLYLEL